MHLQPLPNPTRQHLRDTVAKSEVHLQPLPNPTHQHLRDTVTNRTLNSDMALVSTQVKVLLYIVGLKAGESFDPSMSTSDGVGHKPGHWKINKALTIGGGSGI